MAKRTYGTLRHDPVARRYVIEDAPPHVALRIKDVFRKVNKAQSGQFTFPDDDLHAAELVWFLDRYPMRMADEDLWRLKSGKRRFEAVAEEIEEILLPSFTPPQYAGIAPGYALYPYQAQAVELFRRRKRLLLGDDIGLGKTNTAIGCLLDPDFLPAAVVVEAHLPDQWEERVEGFSNLRTHVIEKMRPYDLPEADVYIFSYNKLQGWVDLFETGFFRSVVYDEPQSLRTGVESQKGKAALTLSKNASAILGLSASPIYNYGIEMHRVLSFIAPDALGTEAEFVREWCNGDDKTVADPQALGTFLREQHLMLRRTEADVGQQMPPPNTIVHTVPYDGARALSAEELARTLAIKATTGSFFERGQAYRELDALARQVTGVAKAKGVADYVRILLEADLPVLLAGWHREVYEVWLEELAEFAPVMYTGTESKAKKRKAKEAFVSGESNLMIISLRSGAGLDGLQHRCSDVVFGELDWSPSVHRQLAGRVRRSGQKEQVNVHFLHADGGSDPVLLETLGLKASQAHGIVNPQLAPEATFSDESRMQKLAEMYLRKHGAPSLNLETAA